MASTRQSSTATRRSTPRSLGDIGDRLGDLTADAFKWWGRFVGRNPGRILIASLVFTVLMAPGISFVRINLDLYKLFVPLDAPVRFEFESQLAYDRMPPGLLSEAPPPPSLIEADPPAASSMQEVPVAESAAKDAAAAGKAGKGGGRAPRSTPSGNVTATTPRPPPVPLPIGEREGFGKSLKSEGILNF
jgi:hypothetical protein